MTGRISVGILTLAASVAVFAAMSSAQTPNAKRPATRAATTQNVPAEYQAGIAQLRIAKGYLEKAGDKWGGYRVRAISSIDQTFKVFGVSPESTRDEMQSGNVDEPGMMDSGISSLQTAKADLAEAGDDWGGRKEKGLALVGQAQNDLQTGIGWAKDPAIPERYTVEGTWYKRRKTGKLAKQPEPPYS
jgi:hypothetical protein